MSSDDKYIYGDSVKTPDDQIEENQENLDAAKASEQRARTRNSVTGRKNGGAINSRVLAPRKTPATHATRSK